MGGRGGERKEEGRIKQRAKELEGYNEEIPRLYPNQEENAYWFTEKWSRDLFVIKCD